MEITVHPNFDPFGKFPPYVIVSVETARYFLQHGFTRAGEGFAVNSRKVDKFPALPSAQFLETEITRRGLRPYIENFLANPTNESFWDLKSREDV